MPGTRFPNCTFTSKEEIVMNRKPFLLMLIALVTMGWTVSCSTPFWKLDGNSIDTSHYVGTINDQPLVLKTNETEAMRIDTAGNMALGRRIRRQPFMFRPQSPGLTR